jgi:hypothetical protein
VAGPFFHGGTIYILLRMLDPDRQPNDTPLRPQKLTSKVIHEIGSSSGIGVLLISFKLKDSSSNSKVKMAPGGVQVPTIK